MSEEFMGIIFTRSIAPDGAVRRQFRVRGQGAAYTNLGKWLHTVKLAREWDSMPWFGWEFADENDEAVLRKVWNSYFLEDDPDYFEEAEVPSIRPEIDKGRRLMEEEFMAILQEEIDKEMAEQIKAKL